MPSLLFQNAWVKLFRDGFQDYWLKGITERELYEVDEAEQKLKELKNDNGKITLTYKCVCFHTFC